VNFILNKEELDEEQQLLADVTEDGIVNILDVVNMVQGILGN